MHELHNDDNDDDELSVSLDDMDLEYLDAATLLHNIGLYTGKKGYHKQSYRIIMVYLHLMFLLCTNLSSGLKEFFRSFNLLLFARGG